MPFCAKCGKEVSEENRFCPNCGYDTKTPRQATVPERPAGISIIAVLQSLAGLGALLLGFIFVLLAGVVGAGTIDFPPDFPVFFGEMVLGIIGLVLILIGLFSFVVAYGFWNGRGWAWMIGIILNILGVLSNLASLPGGIFGLLLNGLILYYLTRPYVKRYFGKEPRTFTI